MTPSKGDVGDLQIGEKEGHELNHLVYGVDMVDY